MPRGRTPQISLKEATRYVRENETITSRQFREHFGCSKSHAKVILGQLLAREIVDYKIVPQGYLYFACDTEDWTSPY